MSTPRFLGPFVTLPTDAPPRGPDAAGTPSGGGGGSKTVPLTMQQQDGDYWCWAATTSSVSRFYDAGSPWTQCHIASTCLAQSCCATPKPCDTPFVLEVPLRTSGNLRGAPFSGAATRRQIQDEIDSDRVVCCFIDWGDLTGHFVAISGYDWGSDDLAIDDPLYAHSTVPYEVFVSSYLGKGSWTYTYLTEA